MASQDTMTGGSSAPTGSMPHASSGLAHSSQLARAAANPLGNPETLPGMDVGPGNPAQRLASDVATSPKSISSSAASAGEQDVASMADDFYRLIKKNPGPALLGAAAAGYLLARTFSRD